ncbi:DNA-directed RNA polymerase II core subunit rpb9 [Geranomyces michiganensis]|nr:DNA-directed RNA polymerase II core subunit rpb9 [Geranomyces michiganensis]
MASFRFCSEWWVHHAVRASRWLKSVREHNNLLYPREERNMRRLMFGCRHCSHEEEADHTQVYEHVVSAVAREMKVEGTDLLVDPTVPQKRKMCPHCNAMRDAIFYPSRSKAREVTMKFAANLSRIRISPSLLVLEFGKPNDAVSAR